MLGKIENYFTSSVPKMLVIMIEKNHRDNDSEDNDWNSELNSDEEVTQIIDSFLSSICYHLTVILIKDVMRELRA